MPVSPDVLRAQLAYTAWASQRLVDAAALLAPEELNRDFQTADHSVLGTLVHVFAADRLWLARLKGEAQRFATDADPSLQALQTEWPTLMKRWDAWAASLSDEQAGARVAYTDMKGRHWEQPLWQLVLHVVNHGTHHRGQASGFLRALGHTPPVLDLAAYYRESDR
jgi:uncharacterized damage-inducible protein DinB